jgi:hypothetical protein
MEIEVVDGPDAGYLWPPAAESLEQPTAPGCGLWFACLAEVCRLDAVLRADCFSMAPDHR